MLTIRRVSKKPLRFTIEDEAPLLGDWYYAGIVKTSTGDFKPRLRWGSRVARKPQKACSSCAWCFAQPLTDKGIYYTECTIKQPGFHPTSTFATYCPEFQKHD